jgi:hypothetical protein
MKFDLTKKWGVEIEFKCTDVRAVRDALNNAGVRTETEHYNHQTRNHWKIVSDSSCGYELVSPPLMGEEGLRELQTALNLLKVHSAVSIDRRCSVHIHHDASDLSVRVLRVAMALYLKYESIIDFMHPRSRRTGNTYIGDYYQDKDNQLKRIKKCNSIQGLVSLFGMTRYRKVNLHVLSRYGTVEFRQAGASLNFEKVKHWLVFTQGILRRGIEKGTTFKQGPISWYKLRNALGFGKDDHTHKALRYLGKRIRHFEREVA